MKEKVTALGKPVSKLIYSGPSDLFPFLLSSSHPGPSTFPRILRLTRRSCHLPGKVLDDAKTVGEVDIKEKDFVVVMFAVRPDASFHPPPLVLHLSLSLDFSLLDKASLPLPAESYRPPRLLHQKAKPAPKAAEPAAPAASPAAASTSTPATDAVTPAAVPATEVPAAAAASTDATMSDAAATSEPASFTNQASFGACLARATLGLPGPPSLTRLLYTVSGEALQSAISNMMEMGFEKDQVMKALRASFNNPDRAVEYLMTVRSLMRLFSPHAPADPLTRVL